jgi:hypothetical protein
MIWLIVTVVVVLMGAGTKLVLDNRRRYPLRIAAEMRALVDVPHSTVPRPAPSALPGPVARYKQLAVGDRAPVHTLHLRHGGTFRLSPHAKARPIKGEQLFTDDPPGFVWVGRIQLAPGVWIDARDTSAAGRGGMQVLLDDTVELVDASGPHLDQGAALRLLAELPWYPTALFDPRTVVWSAIDDDHARATLHVGTAAEVSGTFTFGADGLPISMTGERYSDEGKLEPWGGTYADWRTVSGMRVPFEAEVSWLRPEGPFTYAHWRVESVEYDATIGGHPVS